MYPEERRRTILEEVRKLGRVEVADLSARFAITTETVRRDLTLLEAQGVLRRVHGGAIWRTAGELEKPRTATGNAPMSAENRRIAKAALDFVPETGAILLDTGPTVAGLADLLPVDRELTVVTNAVEVALTLAGKGRITVMLVGGRLKTRPPAAVDSWALRMLHDIHVHVAFLAPCGVSTDGGLTTADPAEAMVKRAVVAAARRSVVLADHTRIGHTDFVRFGDLDDVDTLITDDGLDPALATELTVAGARLLTC